MTQIATPREPLGSLHLTRRTVLVAAAFAALVMLFLACFLPRWHARRALAAATTTAAAGEPQVGVIPPRMESGLRPLTRNDDEWGIST